jgi:hypothetical protein
MTKAVRKSSGVILVVARGEIGFGGKSLCHKIPQELAGVI